MKTASGIPPVNTATIYWATPGHKQVVRPKLRPAETTVSLTVPVHLCLVRAWCPIRRALRCATPRTKRFIVSRQVRDAEPEASAEAAGCADEFLFVVFSTSTKPARNLLHSCRFCFSEFFSRLINKIVRPVFLSTIRAFRDDQALQWPSCPNPTAQSRKSPYPLLCEPDCLIRESRRHSVADSNAVQPERRSYCALRQFWQ